MRSIIFDYNRTIYNPEEGAVFPDILELLQKLKEAGFVLFLVAKGGAERKEQIRALNIGHFFERIAVQSEKTKDDFIQIQNAYKNVTEFFVVGDRIRKEICFGNECGMTTIWFKKGKFANEVPELEIEKPDYIIYELDQLESVFLGS